MGKSVKGVYLREVAGCMTWRFFGGSDAALVSVFFFFFFFFLLFEVIFYYFKLFYNLNVLIFFIR